MVTEVQIAMEPRTKVRAELRKMLDGERMLNRIEQCVTYLMQGSEPVTNAATREVAYVPLTRERLGALKIVLDTQLRLLSKVLPDLKAIEMTDDKGNRLAAGSQDRMVLATKLLAIMREEKQRQVDMPEWFN